MLKRISVSVFCTILYLFASSMLILSLLASIKLTALNDEAVALERERAELREENAELIFEYETMISPEQLEKYAVEVLGMQSPSAEQIEYLVAEPLPEQ